MSNKTKSNARMREAIFKIIENTPPGTLITAQEMCKVLEAADRRLYPWTLRVTNLIRMSDRVEYDRARGGYIVLRVPV